MLSRLTTISNGTFLPGNILDGVIYVLPTPTTRLLASYSVTDTETPVAVCVPLFRTSPTICSPGEYWLLS
jgi:hypothetical protein